MDPPDNSCGNRSITSAGICTSANRGLITSLPEGCAVEVLCLVDRNGSIVLRNALPSEHVAACNASLDDLQHSAPGEWHGRVHGHSFTGSHESLNLQQMYEGGPRWVAFTDHSAWIEKVIDRLTPRQRQIVLPLPPGQTP